MAEDILAGTTDRTVLVFIADPAATDGGGKTGLAHTDMTVSFTRVETDNDVAVTDATSSLNALTNLTDDHNDWGWKEVSSTLAPGLYRLDLADAVLATGAWYAVVYVVITTSLAAPAPMKFRLIDPAVAQLGVNIVNAAGTAWGSGAITNAAFANDAITASKLHADVTTELQSGLATAAALDAVDNFVDTEIASIITTLGTPAGASIAADIAAVKTQTAAIETDTAEIGAAGAGLTVLATAAALDTVDNFLDTEIAAIKAKTDQLTFTVANQVDSNIQYVNDVQVNGTGAVGDEWGP